jgi:hypothetical protein
MEPIGVVVVIEAVLLILLVFPQSHIIEYLFEVVITAILDGCCSFPVLGDPTSAFKQEGDDVPVTVFCCEVECAVAVAVVGVDGDAAVDEGLHHCEVPPQRSDVQSVSTVPGDCVHPRLVLAQQRHQVLVALIAGEVQRRPVVQSLAVHLHWVAVLPLLQHLPRLVVHPLLAVQLQPLVVAVDVGPEVPPTVFGVGGNVWVRVGYRPCRWRVCG